MSVQQSAKFTNIHAIIENGLRSRLSDAFFRLGEENRCKAIAGYFAEFISPLVAFRLPEAEIMESLKKAQAQIGFSRDQPNRFAQLIAAFNEILAEKATELGLTAPLQLQISGETAELSYGSQHYSITAAPNSAGAAEAKRLIAAAQAHSPA